MILLWMSTFLTHLVLRHIEVPPWLLRGHKSAIRQFTVFYYLGLGLGLELGLGLGGIFD